MHPVLEQPRRLLLYLSAWLAAGGLMATALTFSAGLPSAQSAALALPLFVVYAFVCLASWYACQSMPPERSSWSEIVGAHGVATAIASGAWLLAGIGYSILLDRLPFFDDTLDQYRRLLILFLAVGILLYALAVVVHYLLLAFEASRDAESRALELQVKTREAELAALFARREQELAERDLEVARSIQRRLLPPAEMGGDGFRVAARNVPARFVAGDFYDVFHLDDGILGLVVADVAGKGIGASLITASVKAMTPLVAAAQSATGTVSFLNRKLHAELGSREFVALTIALFDTRTGKVEIANCGLPDPYVIDGFGRSRPVEVPGPRLPLGVRADVPYESLCIQLEQGESLMLLTDGLPEARTPAGDPLGYELLATLIEENHCYELPGARLDGLLKSIRVRTSEINEDDLTALVLDRLNPVDARGATLGSVSRDSARPSPGSG